MRIHLEKIDSTKVWEIVDLKAFKSQKHFVAANWMSIVQAKCALGGLKGINTCRIRTTTDMPMPFIS